jgi:hypothetical protein
MSLRLAETTIERLGQRARRAHMPTRTLAQRYVEEGLRMDEHPLVRFVDGAAGRRARLAGTGKDVWEVIATEYLRIPLGLVQAAVTYYGAYRDEIDELIADNERAAAETHAAFQAGQAALAQ